MAIWPRHKGPIRDAYLPDKGKIKNGMVYPNSFKNKETPVTWCPETYASLPCFVCCGGVLTAIAGCSLIAGCLTCCGCSSKKDQDQEKAATMNDHESDNGVPRSANTQPTPEAPMTPTTAVSSMAEESRPVTTTEATETTRQ
ncbi:hypothetical protein LIA77_07815 [Sarocladium implicatum]|nr:hypothetical protein LIA77_07815 [Sarocladium implicatum]